MTAIGSRRMPRHPQAGQYLMTDTKATTDAAAEPTAHAAEPVADPLPWLLRNTQLRRARSASEARERDSRDDTDRKNEGDSRKC
jgi:hypothetical protein